MNSIRESGAQAWLSGKSIFDCPYSDENDRCNYWLSQAGLRQEWMAGYNAAYRNDEIMNICKSMPVCEWGGME